MPQSAPAGDGWKKKKIIIIVVVLGILFAGAGIAFFLAMSSPARERGSQAVQTPRVDPLPEDRDRDGLTNDEEAAAGTSETEFDTDQDGLSDIDEMRVWKTDPKNPDTDGDGFGDGIEVIRGFNPAGPGEL